MSQNTQPTIAGVDLENTSPADLAKMIAELSAMKNKAETELKAVSETAKREALEGIVNYAVDHTEYVDYAKKTATQSGDGIWAGYKVEPTLWKIGEETYTVNVSLTHIRVKDANKLAKAQAEAGAQPVSLVKG